MENFVVSYDVYTIVYISVMCFMGAFIDATVGGGGLITVPAFMSLGWPIPCALGTNKAAAAISLGTSAINYWRAGKTDRFIYNYIPLIALSSAAGAYAVYVIPTDIMQYLVVFFLIAVAIYTFFHKNLGDQGARPLHKHFNLYTIITCIVIGFYDGFFGPGDGALLIFIFIYLGCDFIKAAGNAKVINCAACIGALIYFGINGAIVWQYALISIPSMMAGAITGSSFALKKGVAFIRPLFMAIVVIMIAKQIYNLF